MDRNIYIVEYGTSGKRSRDIRINFYAEDRTWDHYDGLYLGYKDSDDCWQVFKVTHKTVTRSAAFSWNLISGESISNNHTVSLYEAKYIGYSEPADDKFFEKNFEWIEDQKIIEEAEKESCYT